MSDGAVLGMAIASKVKSRFKMRETYGENIVTTLSLPQVIPIMILKKTSTEE